MPTPPESLNTALRELIEVVRTADLAGVDLDPAIATVWDLVEELRPTVHDGVRMQAALRYDDVEAHMAGRMRDTGADDVDELAREGHLSPNEFFPYSPVVGALNPISPPVRMWRAPVEGPVGPTNEIHGEATLGAAFNGPPDCVHGGVIAAVFDELLGSLCVANGLGGFTGTLSVRYRSPTPLDHALTLRAWHDRSEGRKVFARGTLHHGDQLCAEAEGIFVRSAMLPGGGVDPEQV